MWKQRLTICFVAYACCSTSARGLAHYESADDDMSRLLADAKFVFKGTVQKVKAANLSNVPVTDSTIVVRVDEVLDSPKELARYAGKDITMQLRNPGTAPVGRQAIFFASGAIYGNKSIAVKEIGMIDAQNKAPGDLRAQIASERQKSADSNMQRRIAAAQLVIAGKVSEIGVPAGAGRPQLPITEHDPQWQEATVTIDSVEKGDHKEKTVKVLFASSRDVMWYKAPKLKKGEEAIFLLHPNPLKAVGPQGFTLVDPADVQPKSQIQKVKQLIRAAR